MGRWSGPSWSGEAGERSSGERADEEGSNGQPDRRRGGGSSCGRWPDHTEAADLKAYQGGRGDSLNKAAKLQAYRVFRGRVANGGKPYAAPARKIVREPSPRFSRFRRGRGSENQRVAVARSAWLKWYPLRIFYKLTVSHGTQHGGYRMATYDIGEKPGPGEYCCTDCGWSVTLDDFSDPLPPCGNCGAGQDTEYERC